MIVFYRQTIVFNTRAFVFFTLTIVFDTRAFVLNTLTVVFNTRAFVFFTLTIVFHTRAFVFITLTIVFHTRAFVFFTLNIVFYTRVLNRPQRAFYEYNRLFDQLLLHSIIQSAYCVTARTAYSSHCCSLTLPFPSSIKSILSCFPEDVLQSFFAKLLKYMF